MALLGILLMTITKFALPDSHFETILRHPESLNYKIAFFNANVFEGKMRAIFSMIFGAGVLLFCAKETAQRSVTGIFYWRMILLMAFGLMHTHLFLWVGDILFLYGLCGMLLFLFRNMKPAWLLAAALCFIVIEISLNSYFYNHNRIQRIAYLEVVDIEKKGLQLTDEQIKAKEEWKRKEAEYFPDESKTDRFVDVMRSGYWTIARNLRDQFIASETSHAPFSMVDPLALMFLGMALFKWGFFSGFLPDRIYVWLLIIGYCIGYPLVFYSWDILMTAPNIVEFFEANPFNIRVLIQPLQRMLLGVGHVSLLILLLRRGFFKRLTNMLGAVGKMAFSNYIMHTAICSFIFFGYGLGYFGRLKYHELYYIVIAIWILQLVISPIWFKYFRFGPLEWAWRSLTYWKVQPMRVSREETDLQTLV